MENTTTLNSLNAAGNSPEMARGIEIDGFLEHLDAEEFGGLEKYQKVGDALGMGSYGVVYRSVHILQPLCVAYGSNDYMTSNAFNVVLLDLRYRLKDRDQNPALPEDVAIKVIHKHLLPSLDEKAEKAAREINIQASLRHPNIVRCYGYCFVNGTFSIVTRSQGAFSVVTQYCQMDLSIYIKKHGT